MKLPALKIFELKKIYIDSLGEWVEVPVWDQTDLVEMVRLIDWEGLDMRQYKKILVEHWPGLSPSVRMKLKNPATRDELYEILINENWGLKPGNMLESSSYYTRVEAANVQMWFASNKVKGRAPEVISG